MWSFGCIMSELYMGMKIFFKIFLKFKYIYNKIFNNKLLKIIYIYNNIFNYKLFIEK